MRSSIPYKSAAVNRNHEPVHGCFFFIPAEKNPTFPREVPFLHGYNSGLAGKGRICFRKGQHSASSTIGMISACLPCFHCFNGHTDKASKFLLRQSGAQ